MIRVLYVEDYASLRESLTSVLEREPDIAVVQAATLAEARGLVNDIDVVLVDLTLPDGEGTDLIPEFKRHNLLGGALVLTGGKDRGSVARVVRAGAAGVLYKLASPGLITEAIRKVAAGELLLSPEELVEMEALLSEQEAREQQEQQERERLETLTNREMEILEKLAIGLGNKGIAREMGISIKTVHAHLDNIYGKLDVYSRVQAVVLALKHEVVKPQR